MAGVRLLVVDMDTGMMDSDLSAMGLVAEVVVVAMVKVEAVVAMTFVMKVTPTVMVNKLCANQEYFSPNRTESKSTSRKQVL